MKTRIFFGCLCLLVAIAFSLLSQLWRITHSDSTIKEIVAKNAPLPGQINDLNYEKIQIGMTELDVEKILGGSYGQYFKGKAFFWCPRGNHNNSEPIQCENVEEDILLFAMRFNGEVILLRKGWVGPELGIWIWFSRDGIVQGKESYKVRLITKSGEGK
jgi:hypothetical protein